MTIIMPSIAGLLWFSRANRKATAPSSREATAWHIRCSSSCVRWWRRRRILCEFVLTLPIWWANTFRPPTFVTPPRRNRSKPSLAAAHATLAGNRSLLPDGCGGGASAGLRTKPRCCWRHTRRQPLAAACLRQQPALPWRKVVSGACKHGREKWVAERRER